MLRLLICFSLLLSGAKSRNVNSPCATECKHVHWGYTGASGPKCWGSCNPQCKGHRQSPIDLETRKATFMGVFDVPEVSGPLAVKMMANNNGHTIVFSKTGEKPIKVSGLGLRATYMLDQFHFHWGFVDSVGSEHTLNGRHWPMEMQVVTHNEKYQSIGEARSAPDGLAVFAYFFQIVNEDNDELSSLLSVFDQVDKKGASTSVVIMELLRLLPPFGGDFFRYKGSLTTPGCFESVTWTVFVGSTLFISEHQMKHVRQIMTSDESGEHERPMFNNFRPTQPLNSRDLFIGSISTLKT